MLSIDRPPLSPWAVAEWHPGSTAHPDQRPRQSRGAADRRPERSVRVRCCPSIPGTRLGPESVACAGSSGGITRCVIGRSEPTRLCSVRAWPALIDSSTPFCLIGAAPSSSTPHGSSDSPECSNGSAAHTTGERSTTVASVRRGQGPSGSDRVGSTLRPLRCESRSVQAAHLQAGRIRRRAGCST